MIRITRRDFLKYCAISAGALGLSASTLMKIDNVLAKTDNGAPAVVWIAGAACTGCTTSLLNEVFYTTIDNVLLDQLDMKILDTIQAAAGSYVNTVQSPVANSLAVSQAIYNGGASTGAPFVLVVEGAIPTATPPGSAIPGDYCRVGQLTSTTGPETMLANVNLFASHPDCAAILAVGTCSSFGGVPGALGNVTGAKGVAFSGTAMGGAVIGNGGNGVHDVSVKADGAGYDDGTNAIPPSVTFNPAITGTAATPVMALGVTQLNVTTGGTWAVRPDVTIAPSSGYQATAMAVIDGAGVLTDIKITFKGTGYVIATPPSVTITAVPGDTVSVAGGSATALVSGYVADFTSVTSATGYTTAPAVELSAPASPTVGLTLIQAEAAAVMDFGGNVNSVKFRTGLAAKLINISGCPPHPDWIIGTIAYVLDYLPAVLAGTATASQLIPTLNRNYQPIDFGYGAYQCNAGPCPWRYQNTQAVGTTGRTPGALEYNRRYPEGNSKALGVYKWQRSVSNGGTFDLGCLGILGCKGRKTKADCSARRWNADDLEQFGVNWCVGSRGGCHGCTEPTFPDKVGKFFTFV